MADLGTGVIVLLVLWLFAIALMLVLCSAQGKLKTLSIVPSILVAIVTIVLVSLPRGADVYNQDDPAYNYSYTPLIWILTFTGLCVFLFVALFLYLVFDIMEPHYAKVSKTFRVR